jgi:hypothetical protein
MAKQKPEPGSVSLLESRAWDLFCARVNVDGISTVTPDHLARECFKAASVFQAVADQETDRTTTAIPFAGAKAS